jgi:uncharacterized protein YjlB
LIEVLVDVAGVVDGRIVVVVGGGEGSRVLVVVFRVLVIPAAG